ncbi:MAG: D-alanyl-D-alanine carboxypeptidase family protein, partial [Pseudomonadota bacterium]
GQHQETELRVLFQKAFLVFLLAWVTPAGAAAPFDTPATYALIMDYETGAVLFEKNADEPTAPASMSKLMTVAIVFDKIKRGELSPSDEFYVSEKAWSKRGSKMWVRVDTKIPLIDLLRGVIIQSGNDACIVIAENISGTEEAFAELMTRTARSWGMENSTFANASGWPDPDQKMSMRDLAMLARRIIMEHPEYYSIFAEDKFTWEGIEQANRNPLLGAFDGADGLKTGHTDESGYGLVGTAVRDGVRRIIVMNGLGSEKARAIETRRFMRIAFNDFQKVQLFGRGDIVGEASVFAGKAPTVPLVVSTPIERIVHRSQLDQVKATFVYDGPLEAPVAEAQQVGYLKLHVADEVVSEHPLYAGRNVSALGVFGKIGLAAKVLLAKPDRGGEAAVQ